MFRDIVYIFDSKRTYAIHAGMTTFAAQCKCWLCYHVAFKLFCHCIFQESL